MVLKSIITSLTERIMWNGNDWLYCLSYLDRVSIFLLKFACMYPIYWTTKNIGRRHHAFWRHKIIVLFFLTCWHLEGGIITWMNTQRSVNYWNSCAHFSVYCNNQWWKIHHLPSWMDECGDNSWRYQMILTYENVWEMSYNHYYGF